MKKLTIEQKRERLKRGLKIELETRVDPKAERRRKKELEKLAKRFGRYISGERD